MINRIDEDLHAWAAWYECQIDRCCLSYPARSTVAATMDGMGRSSVPGSRVPLFESSTYNRRLSLAIAKLPVEQQQFLERVYLKRDLKARQPGATHTQTWFYRRLHRLHVALAGMLRE